MSFILTRTACANKCQKAVQFETLLTIIRRKVSTWLLLSARTAPHAAAEQRQISEPSQLFAVKVAETFGQNNINPSRFCVNLRADIHG
jgi:hypothetical protein